MNTETSRLNNAPHGTFDDWMRDAMEVVGGVAAIVTCAIVGGDTQAADDELRKLAPAVQELAQSFTELTKPKKTKDVNAELAKLRAMLGEPKTAKPTPQKGIERDDLSDELGKIAAMLSEYDPGFSPLASRLFVLSNRIAREGVYVDDSVPF